MRIIDGVFSKTTLKGKVSIVTGAGRGLGKAMALGLAKAGSDMVVVARTQEAVDSTAKEIEGMGQKALAVKADITRSDDISKMVEKVIAEFGKIDVLVNNAGQNGSFARHKFEDIPENEWGSLIQTNITGMFLVTQIVGRTMLARGSGKIINISSAMGMKPVPLGIAYGMTKAAIIYLTKSLAIEWAPRGVTVNSIAPGVFDMYPDSTDEKYLNLNQERVKRVPLGRLGRGEELGSLAVYLASDASDYITGETILIDGGRL
jgi:NAD(P)-dependent dehydrogenase (short-subunit alcohol dehydrogenase family)